MQTTSFATLAIVLTLFSGATAAPPAPGPDEVVRRIYADHQPWAGKNIDLSDVKALKKYFDDSLVELLKKDEDYSAKNGEVGCLDWDPFLAAQDYDEAGITTPQITTISGTTGFICEVTFTGKSKAWKDWNVKLMYDVRKTKAGWRVYDIIDPKGDSLRKALHCLDK